MSKSPKPSAVYRNRLQRYPDEVWLIWSNKWGCWYRDNSQGYTPDIERAGLFTRAEAAAHYTDPKLPRAYRITEPFPLSSVRAMLLRRREQVEREASETLNRIDLALACDRLQATPPMLEGAR